MENIFWTGYSNDERNAGIPVIQKTVSGYGDIIDTKLFSDISLTMIIEIKERNIDALYEALQNIIGMDKHTRLYSTAGRERTLYLNITFSRATGNLAIETPSVPG